MKKCVFLLVIVLIANSLTNAQYRINKTQFDRRAYHYQPGDPYNPTISGIASLWIPGLGQILAGETGRGLAFMLPWATPFMVYFVSSYSEENHSKAFNVFGNDILPVYMAGMAIWSCIDGVRVAKVNNLAWRDKSKTSSKLELNPYFTTLQYHPEGQVITGISLKFTF